MQLFRRVSSDEAEKHFKQGLRHRNRRSKEFNFDLAVKHFQEAIRLNPGIGKYHRELGKAYVAAPLLAVTQGIGGDMALEQYLKLAFDELTESLQYDAGQAETYLILGEAYMYSGRRQDATTAFQTAIDTPSFSFSFFFPVSLIDGRLLKSYAKRQLKYLGQGAGTQSQPSIAGECIRQAIVYRDEGKYKLAEKELMQALKLAPDWSWFHKTLCRLAG